MLPERRVPGAPAGVWAWAFSLTLSTRRRYALWRFHAGDGRLAQAPMVLTRHSVC
jgi:hypothetical protein